MPKILGPWALRLALPEYVAAVFEGAFREGQKWPDTAIF